MSTVNELAPIETAAPAEKRPREHGPRYGTYLAVVLLVPFFLMLAAFPVARTDFFLHTSRRTLWHGMVYHMENQAGENCDVVIFGDSTGMVGLKPVQIEAATGMKTCLLALPYMTVSATGTMVLDHYLKENRPPKYIVFANHVTHLKPAELDEEPGIIDGWWFIDRTYPPLQAAKFFLRHPRYSFIFAADIWQSSTSLTESLRPDFSKHSFYGDMAMLQRNRGYFQMDYRGTRDQICLPLFAQPTVDARYMEPLKKYQTAQTQVVFYISPVANCDPYTKSYDALARSLGITPPLQLPWKDFSDDRHLVAEGASADTDGLIKILLNLEHR